MLCAYDEILSEIQAASLNDSQRPAALTGLGLENFQPTTPLNNLSGGQRTRLALAGLLLSSPDLILLDEPTNHLDIKMLEWLEEWLLFSNEANRSGILLVSHDRLLLEHIATGVLGLDPATHQLQTYPGDYSDYLTAKLVESRRSWQSYHEQQEEISRLRIAAQELRSKATFKRGGKGDSGDKFAKGFFGNRAKRQVGRAKQIKGKVQKLLKVDHIEKPRQEWQMKLDFQSSLGSSRQVLVLKDLSIGYLTNPILKDINLEVRYGQRIALIGPNGSGKTTLFRTISGLLPAIAGKNRFGRSTRLGYSSQEQEFLDSNLNAFETLQQQCAWSEKEVRTFLHKFLFSGDDVYIKNRDLSFGERSRLILARLAAGGADLLLLDEPINHLDIPSRAQFEVSLLAFSGTVIAAIHDRYFISNYATRIWEINDRTVRDINLD